MIRRMKVFLACALGAALLVSIAPTLDAQKTALDDLCRLHGIGEAESIVKIKRAYLAAADAGIPEEELTPFVEDILRHKLNCDQMVKVLAVAAELRKNKLPYFVVFSKVREGVAKGAPPAIVVEAAVSKLRTLTNSRDVLLSLESSGYRVLDFQNAAVIVGSYLEKGYTTKEVVTQISQKGIEGAGFAALAGVLEKPMTTKER